MKKITINEDECIGCGSCESISPDHFELRNGKSHVKKQYCEEDKGEIEEAKDNCPTNAIEITKE